MEAIKEKELKKKNKKYLAARHKTDQCIRIIKMGNKKIDFNIKH